MTDWIDQEDMPESSQALASVMAFLGSEIDHSQAMLRDLATCLSDVIASFGAAATESTPCLAHASQALQNEDRIQQRLSDLRSALLVLEHVLQASASPPGADLDRMIIDQMRLDEMRNAYAASVGMPGYEMKSKADVTAPSAGDVDLF